MDVHIAAVGTALPGPPVSNEALVRRFGLPSVWEQWIDTFVGTRARHFAIDLETGKLCHTLADMGTAAATRALDRAGRTGADVDLVVMGTATPDMLMPATVNVIADRLGIDGVPTFQLQSGCTGAVQALSIAAQLLGTGGYRTALVLGGETCAKHLDLDMDLPTMSVNVQINAMLFGDGAGAAVLTTDPAPNSPVLRHAFTRLVGLGRAPGQTVEYFGQADRTSNREAVAEDFKAVEESAPPMAASALRDVLDHLGWQPADLSYLLPPQLSGAMTDRVLEALDVPGAHEVSQVAEIGNTANAIPFFQLDSVLPELAPGDRLAGVSVEASKWIKAGYALEMPDPDLEGV
jgi:3-oxoacyl-[acyl-carrier-protein] synthase-3